MSDYKIQPLRVCPDWQVLYNLFFEIDEITEENFDYVDSVYLLKLYSQSRNQFISMWWSPEADINGCYHIEIYHTLEVFNERTGEIDIKFEEEPHTIFESKNRLEVVEKLEDFMRHLQIHEDPRILKSRAVVDEPSESYRLELLSNGLTEGLITNILKDGNKQIHILALGHKNINREIIVRFFNESRFSKMKKKAEQMLNNKKFR